MFLHHISGRSIIIKETVPEIHFLLGDCKLFYDASNNNNMEGILLSHRRISCTILIKKCISLLSLKNIIGIRFSYLSKFNSIILKYQAKCQYRQLIDSYLLTFSDKILKN